MRMLLILASMVLLAGCSVQSSQFSAVMDLVNKPSTNLPLNSWSVRYGDYESIVYPVTLPEATLFSNQTGDQVLFDGWSVRSFSGLGLQGPAHQNIDVAKERTFFRGSQLLAVHQCYQWQQKQLPGKKKFYQLCKGDIVYTNHIIVDESGDIKLIHQIVDNKYEPVIITKLN